MDQITKDQLDLTAEEDVVRLMESSKTEDEWNNYSLRVKASNGGNYPSFWYAAIIKSGVAADRRNAFLYFKGQ